jgi:hypothetical protein
VTESEVLSLVRGEMRRVLGEVVCGMDAHDVIDAAQIGVGIRALSAPASPPVEPQPAATGLEMPPLSDAYDFLFLRAKHRPGDDWTVHRKEVDEFWEIVKNREQARLDRALALLAEKDARIAELEAEKG